MLFYSFVCICVCVHIWIYACISVEYCDSHWDAPAQIQEQCASSWEVFGQQTTASCHLLHGLPQIQRAALPVVLPFLESLYHVTKWGEHTEAWAISRYHETIWAETSPSRAFHRIGWGFIKFALQFQFCLCSSLHPSAFSCEYDSQKLLAPQVPFSP